MSEVQVKDAATNVASPAEETSEGSIDLGALGGNAFTPYVFDRSAGWVLLPLLALVLVSLHLRKNRNSKIRRNPDAQS